MRYLSFALNLQNELRVNLSSLEATANRKDKGETFRESQEAYGCRTGILRFENRSGTSSAPFVGKRLRKLPVIADDHKVVGTITDRDICMAAATKHRPPGEITVGEVIDGNVYTCRLDTDLDEAMLTMKQEQVRRLPVVDADGKLQGVLSLADIILSAEPHSAKAVKLSAASIMETLKAICSPRAVSVPEPQKVQGNGA